MIKDSTSFTSHLKITARISRPIFAFWTLSKFESTESNYFSWISLNLLKFLKFFFFLNSLEDHPDQLIKNYLDAEANVIEADTTQPIVRLIISDVQLSFYYSCIEAAKTHQSRYVFLNFFLFDVRWTFFHQFFCSDLKDYIVFLTDFML